MKIKLSAATGKVKLTVLNTISQSNIQQIRNDYSCKIGCHSCCFRMVKLTVAEAMIIYSYLIEKNEWAEVQTKAREQIKISKNVDPTTWFKMRIGCPVLDDDKKTCRAHQVRPPFCSTHFVKSSPEACDPWYVGNESYEPAYLEDIYKTAMKRIGDSVDGGGILGMELPIQTALLLAEKVSVKTGLDFQQILKIMSNEFQS